MNLVERWADYLNSSSRLETIRTFAGLVSIFLIAIIILAMGLSIVVVPLFILILYPLMITFFVFAEKAVSKVIKR